MVEQRPERIVRGQRVDPVKRERARELRRAMTPAEAALWERIRAHRFMGLHFRRQQIVDGFLLDFYCHALGLALEVDGAIHQFQEVYDAERDRILAARGIRVVRLRNDAVLTDLDAQIQSLAELVMERQPG